MKKFFTKKNIAILLVTSIVMLVGAELVARYFLGLGDPPIYIVDTEYEYIPAPNQNLYRFHKHYVTNNFSMRSLPLSEKDDIRILKIGDSIINGGSLTDQDSLATTILEKKLSSRYGKNIRVLNISAGSWGPDNAFAYLQKHGHFNAKMVVMVFSSHDYWDSMFFEGLVGFDPSYPDKKPLCALTDGFFRYVLPKFYVNKKDINKLQGIGVMNQQLNPGWVQIKDYCAKHDLPLLVVHHKTIKEVNAKDHNWMGKELANIMDSLQLNVIRELDMEFGAEYYRDQIHFNERGQKQLVSEVEPWLVQQIDSLLIKRAVLVDSMNTDLPLEGAGR